MKKYFILFTLMLLVFNYSYSVSKIMPENDWKKMNLKGRVMKMVKKVHKYNIDGKSLGEEEVTFIFNSQGYIINEVQYVDNRLNQSIIYKNNSNGLPTKKDEVSRVYSYKYEETKDGNLTYQVANRVEVVDITKGKGNDVGIYEKKVIEYEYYE